VNSTTYRSLVKAYGLKIIISVDGKAGKFDFIPLLITLGAGLGLLSVATLVADFVLLYFTSKKELYREIKQLEFSEEDDIGVN
jgi:P2X purinoceptor 4